MTTGTPGDEEGPDQSENGLYNTHAYTVLGAVVLSTGDKLIKVRNPFGHDHEEWDSGYVGKWNDNDSDNWTEALKTELNYVPANDGTFYMDYEEFHASMTETWINPSTLNWEQDYFLKINDTSGGEGRTKHRLTVKNTHSAS